VLIIAGALAALAFDVRPAEARGPSTPEERAKFVALTRSLELDPLAENASATRQRLQDWVIEVPDIRFKVCTELLGDALGDEYPYSRELNVQAVLSGAVLTLEDPGEARDDVAVYTAGVEGALRAYQMLVQSRPDAHSAALDDLLEKQRQHELADHIARLAKKKCKRTNKNLIAAPIGAAVGLLLALLVAHWFGGGITRARVAQEVTLARVSTRVAPILRKVVFVCAAYYLIVGIALHFLEPEYDPRFYPMSHYVWGAYGWLMTTTFFVLGLAILTVGLGLRSVDLSSRNARIGFGLLVVGALFVCLAGVFKEFPLHDMAGGIGLPSVAMAVLLLSWSFLKTAEWQPIGTATTLIAVVMLGALLSIIAGVGMPGLQQRAFLFLLLLWLSIVAHRLVRVIDDVRGERRT
jgi:hypothetical membrane protein